MRGLIVTIAGFLAAAAWTPDHASAHPHVWADMRATLLVGQTGLITGVRVEWTFDKAYSSVATDGLDANGDGVFSDAELAPLTEVNLASLKTYDYFIFMRMDGKLLKHGAATNPAQSYANGRLTLDFTLQLAKPVDPGEGTFDVKIYDPEFFIDFEFAKTKPYAVSGVLPVSCRAKLTPIQSSAQINQTLLMLSTKGTDWKPENGEDFGSLFAQSILVGCGT